MVGDTGMACQPPSPAFSLGQSVPSGLLTGLGLGLLIFISVFLCQGHLMYTLDDPYIHLALARNIQEGGYGINPGEWASPSSSVLWPFMLALVPARYIEWGPVVINALCCVVSACYLDLKLQQTLLPAWARTWTAFALAMGMNFLGLVMTGMEHSLQLMLVVIAGVHISSGRCNNLTYLALGLMPLIRYECLALTYPLLAYLALKDNATKAGITALIVTGSLIAFSWFLHSKGLPWLPCSVLAKSEMGIPFLGNWKGQPALIALMGWLLYHFQRQKLELVLLLVIPALLYFAAGKTGWFGRYETFIVAYLVIFGIHTLRPSPADRRASQLGNSAPWVGLICLGMAASFPTLVECTLRTPQGAKNIWQQQQVMAQLAKELGEPVAVNDLGLVALRSGQPVLDLWGLGSYDALVARRAEGAASSLWIQQVMNKHDVRYAFVYDRWFPNTPDNWIKVGELILPNKRVTPADDRVALYATSTASADKLRQALERYRLTGDQGWLLRTSHHAVAANGGLGL
jgi:hypothetical protein